MSSGKHENDRPDRLDRFEKLAVSRASPEQETKTRTRSVGVVGSATTDLPCEGRWGTARGYRKQCQLESKPALRVWETWPGPAETLHLALSPYLRNSKRRSQPARNTVEFQVQEYR